MARRVLLTFLITVLPAIVLTRSEGLAVRAGALMIQSQRQNSPSECENPLTLKIAGTSITSAQIVEAGGFAPPGVPANNPAMAGYRSLPAFCRVEGVIRPSTDSEIQFEVWAPVEGWNGKYLGLGNGGFAGSIVYPSMAEALRAGYATSSTDTGHKGTSTEFKWAQGHPEKLIDYGYRAIHEVAAQSKTIILALSGRSPAKSYFSSCSNGGRQGLMEAQRFPEDYDGIIAGAPSLDPTKIGAGYAWNLQALEVTPGSYIPASKLPAIESAVLDACDARDGVSDGVLDDPRKCSFDPRVLLCKSADSDGCLTEPQVSALQKVYAGPIDSSGRRVEEGFLPGGEAGQTGWRAWITGAAPGTSLQFAFSMALADAYSVDIKTYNFDKDPQKWEELLGMTLNAVNPDLRAFNARGGKLILFHGWSDAAIPPTGTIRYYESVGSTVGAEVAQRFVRLYMIPGMQHCGGGAGPNAFDPVPTSELSPNRSMFRALERWTEQTITPESIIGTRYTTPGNPASGLLRTRPLCPYPQAARYRGSGSTDNAANFVCRE
jgi:feruloyl esterase